MESQQSIKCLLCDASSPSKYHLAEHICRHLSYRKYKCKTCAEFFYTEEERDAHCIERNHIHTSEMRISQYCEHYVNLLLKDAEYVAIHGIDAVLVQRTKASLACHLESSPKATVTIQLNKDASPDPDQPNPRASDGTVVNKSQQITTGNGDCKLNVASDQLTDFSLNQPEDYFPWSRLPEELQVKVLRYLTRSDLDKCRVLDWKTSQLIRRNKRIMQRRIIEYLNIRIFESKVQEADFRLKLFVRCSEVGITHDRDLSVLNRRQQRAPYTFEHALQHLQESFSPWGCSILPKLLKNATIQHLEIGNGCLTDNILWPISSCLLNVDCRVQKLSIKETSFAAITSSIFLEFLRNAAPTHIYIYEIRDCSYDNFSPEVLEFIVTRPKFEIIYVQPEPFPIDDDIFAKLTASEFTIDVTTKITADGIKSFVGGLASGKHEVVKGLIRTGVFSSSSPFSTPSNVKVSLITDPNNMYNSKPYYIEITATTKCTAKTKT